MKLSGLSSFLVFGDFTKDISDALSVEEAYYFHKKMNAWEVPASRLSAILDKLTLLTEIRLEMQKWIEPDMEEGKLTESETTQFRIRPYDHQLDAINYALVKKRFLLLDSMGVGKTNEIIWTAETLKRRGLIDHCLVICGVNAVKQNWKKEIQKFSTETVRVLGEKITRNGTIRYKTIPERAKELREPISEFFVVTNIETLRSKEIIDALVDSENRFGMMALDEAHKVATKTSNQGTNLLKIAADYMIAATGTLITNSPISCYMPLVWTGNDHALLTQYKNQYCVMGGEHDNQVMGYRNLDMLKEEIDHCSLRRTLADVGGKDMPPKRVDFELVEMDEGHRKFYEAIRDGVKEEADKIELNSSNLLALTTRLRQATASPSILSSQGIESTKLERCVELVEEIVSQGEKVVVMSNFKEPVYRLAELLKKHSPLVNTGDIPDDLISKNVDRFQNDPNSKIFLGTHSKVGTGLTLNAAMYMICVDTPFTYSSFAQSCDRIYRINNTRPAYITVLACKDTIDERVNEIIEQKKDLSDYLVDGDETTAVANSMREYILGL